MNNFEVEEERLEVAFEIYLRLQKADLDAVMSLIMTKIHEHGGNVDVMRREVEDIVNDARQMPIGVQHGQTPGAHGMGFETLPEEYLQAADAHEEAKSGIDLMDGGRTEMDRDTRKIIRECGMVAPVPDQSGQKAVYTHTPEGISVSQAPAAPNVFEKNAALEQAHPESYPPDHEKGGAWTIHEAALESGKTIPEKTEITEAKP